MLDQYKKLIQHTKQGYSSIRHGREINNATKLKIAKIGFGLCNSTEIKNNTEELNLEHLKRIA
jgi:hypothetical protein